MRVFTSWRMAVVLLLGFTAGMPLALTASTLQAWMKADKIDIAVIGLFALVGIPYAFKFVWAPLLDRFEAPAPFNRLGRRRGWLLFWQLALIGSISVMAFSDPLAHPATIALLATLVAFASSSQDIIFDAYRVELLTKREYGPSSGIYTMGYRAAMIVSSSGAFILSDHFSWRMVYLTMAAITTIGPVTTFFAPEPKIDLKPPQSLREAVVQPFVDFFRRRGAFEVLGFMILYKLDVALTVAMTTVFMLDLGFTRTDIGIVTKGFGMVATVAGTLVGGTLMLRMTVKTALWIFGIAQAASGLSYMALAHVGHSYAMMATAITVENFCSGMAIAAGSAFMMSLCNKRFTATQYALLSSFMALTRYVAAAPSGYLAKAVGWEGYYLIAAFISIPGLLLLLRYDRWTIPSN